MNLCELCGYSAKKTVTRLLSCAKFKINCTEFKISRISACIYTLLKGSSALRSRNISQELRERASLFISRNGQKASSPRPQSADTAGKMRSRHGMLLDSASQ